MTDDEVLRSIKLVIWDLDDTFWSGTLAENTAKEITRNIEIVKALLRRGIVNSIASNNDRAAATAALKRLNVLDLFVLPQISWGAKGTMVAQIIADCQLRPENVLFIDDNARIRGEVEHANPKISTIAPAVLRSFDIEKWKVSDPEMERLKRYKDLERKCVFRQLHPMPDRQFLRMSQIAISINQSVRGEADRIVELTDRAHQLNFTKRKLTADELASLLASPDHECWSIAVTDRFAHYGLCGFACVDRRADRLTQFVFSCRVLNMGVEQFVYAHLGRPELRVMQPVSSDPLQGPTPDWIQLERRLKNAASKSPGERLPRVFVKGSCDLLAVADYLESSSSIGRIDCEFDRPKKDGRVAVLHNHLAVLRLLHDTKKWQRVRDVVKVFPWFDESTERTALFSSVHDVYVLSIARDLQAGMYRHKHTGLLLPFDDIDVCWTDVKNREWMLSVCKYKKQHGLDREFLDWLSRHFDYVGAQDVATIADNVRWLRSVLPQESTLLILDASEVLPANSDFGKMSYLNQARAVNLSLREASVSLSATSIIEVSKIIQSRDDLVGSPSHYVRHVYYSIAGEILNALKAPANTLT